jgi:pre-mRNA-splicing factor 18
MDFASLMSKAISKSVPPKNTSTNDSNGTSKQSSPPKKYLKKSELVAQRQEQYLAEQRALEELKEAKLQQKRKRQEEEDEANRVREEKKRRLAEESKIKREQQEAEEDRAMRKRLGLPELVKEEVEEVVKDDIPDDELVEKLREMGHPARLFGESHKQRLNRFKKLGVIMTTGPIPTSLALVEEKDMKVDAMPKDEEGRKYLFRQLASYFTMVLTEWDRALSKEARDTFASKQAYNAMIASKENMTPVSLCSRARLAPFANIDQLFRKFESGDLEDSVLEPIVEIVKAAQERRYVDANDGYLRLSIGKAAWPIGVTMVGIHERSAREKLHESDKGHVMGDEVTRKFLQSIKRCLSFAQVRWPPEDIRQLMG